MIHTGQTNPLHQGRPMQWQLAYKVETTFENVAFLLAKYGWLEAVEPETRGSTVRYYHQQGAYNAFESVAGIDSDCNVGFSTMSHQDQLLQLERAQALICRTSVHTTGPH